MGCATVSQWLKGGEPERVLLQAEHAVAKIKQIAVASYKALCLPVAMKCIAENDAKCQDFDQCVSGLYQIIDWLDECERLLDEARLAYQGKQFDKIITIVGKIMQLVQHIQDDVASVQQQLASRTSI